MSLVFFLVLSSIGFIFSGGLSNPKPRITQRMRHNSSPNLRCKSSELTQSPPGSNHETKVLFPSLQRHGTSTGSKNQSYNDHRAMIAKRAKVFYIVLSSYHLLPVVWYVNHRCHTFDWQYINMLLFLLSSFHEKRTGFCTMNFNIISNTRPRRF